MQKRLENGLIFISIVSLVATLGSLYFSEIRGFEPCTLCWYQRILMYPDHTYFRHCTFPEECTYRFNDSSFLVHWGWHFSLSLWNSKARFLSDSAPCLRTCSVYRSICELLGVHHNSISRTHCICTNFNHKPFHLEMAKGDEIS